MDKQMEPENGKTGENEILLNSHPFPHVPNANKLESNGVQPHVNHSILNEEVAQRGETIRCNASSDAEPTMNLSQPSIVDKSGSLRHLQDAPSYHGNQGKPGPSVEKTCIHGAETLEALHRLEECQKYLEQNCEGSFSSLGEVQVDFSNMAISSIEKHRSISADEVPEVPPRTCSITSGDANRFDNLSDNRSIHLENSLSHNERCPSPQQITYENFKEAPETDIVD